MYVAAVRVLVLGAGFGGLELVTRLSDEFGEDIEVVLVDRNDAFVFGFSKLDVMFGRARPREVRHLYGGIVKPGVRFVQTAVHSIDPVARQRGDRCRAAGWGHHGRGARRRSGSGGHAGPAGGRPRVLHGGRGVRSAR